MEDYTFKILRSMLTVAMLAWGALFLSACSFQSSACELPNFSEYTGPNEDLLILAGECVVPSVLETIKDKNARYRAAMIGFLGDGEYSIAIDQLTSIVNDPDDPNRDSAIIALFRINEESGRQLAGRYRTAEGELGKVSKHILENKPYLKERKSYPEALRSYISHRWAI